MESLWQDIRFGLRTLRKSPAFALVAIAALALGIGANTAIFSIVNGVMLRPLPFPEPDRLMDIYHVYPGLGLNHVTVSPVTLDFYRKNQRSFESIGAFSGWRAPANLTGSGEPQRIRSISVAGEFFRTMGVNPVAGRYITAEDDQPGHSRVVVLGNGLWKRLFAGDPAMVGKTITLDGNNYDVIGIMPASFDYPSKTDLWIPMGMTPQEWQQGVEYMNVVGRLKPGVSQKQAKAEMTQLTAALRSAYPKDFEGDTSGWRVDTQPLSELIRGDLRPALLVLLAAVGCVLLIACVNVANLLLARATARHREIATRAAIGARRLRIVRQLVTESMVLWLAGGLAGLLLGYIAVAVLLSLLPIELPTFIKINVDPTVMTFTLLLALITGVLFGLVPAWRLSSPDLIDALKEGRGPVAGSHSRVRDSLVVGEMALAVLLLVAAGLMIRSFVKYQGARIGFDPDHVLTFMAALPEQKYKTPAQSRAFFREAEQRLKTIPGVERVGMVSTLPLIGSGWMNSYTIQGKQLRPQPHSYFALASPDYFQSLRIDLIRGRLFRDSDVEDAPLVVLIDDKAVKMYFGNEDPIGQHISMDNDPATKKPRWREIVGVVGSVKHTANIRDDPKGQVYLPYTQLAAPPEMMFAIRTSGDPNAIVASARAKIREVDSEQPIFEVSTMDKIRDENIAAPRFNTILLGIFGGLALVLAAVGIYGVLSYTVTQRTHEIGLRMALGASQANVLGIVMKHAARLAAIGLGIGLAAALVATRLLSSLLFHVSRTDPATYAAIVTVLGTVALLASYAPARRAAKVDPMIALRNA
jgi:putative ABC transport system permease protein